ncbi:MULTISPECIES: hypothetical protein [Pseudomonas]|uniref:hypothetical protein n=1 Tax=Pseudomonas TaxID=286 RepID=UPI000B35D32D|nr:MULTISPECIES: hypothetical protein [Pseudomonas]PMY71025.1 hypothetical protein C1Y31_01700 [Pseudomonas sp. FW305-25]PMY75554.1 hypothetical protein C1Y32_02725 [Pseudomonas sp. FW126-L8]PNA81424.1 hypothetical protein C1Y33_07730 [Pseudomonas sp. FW305-76]
MSPHILIDQALEGVSDPASQADMSVLVQQLITRLYTDELITTEEFSHYCKRLLNICQQRKEAA